MDCAICLAPLSENIKHLSCNHVFHDTCLKPWFTQHTTCPLCRKDVRVITSEEIIALMNKYREEENHIAMIQTVIDETFEYRMQQALAEIIEINKEIAFLKIQIKTKTNKLHRVAIFIRHVINAKKQAREIKDEVLGRSLRNELSWRQRESLHLRMDVRDHKTMLKKLEKRLKEFQINPM